MQQTPASDPAPRLVLVDPTLRDALGHNLDYDSLVCDEAKRAGLVPLVWSHVEAKLGPYFPHKLVPWFRAGMKDAAPHRKLARLIRSAFGQDAYAVLRNLKRVAVPTSPSPEEGERLRAESFASDLKRLFAANPSQTGDRLFFPHLSWAEAAHAAHLSATHGSWSKAKTFILLRFDPPASRAARDLIAAAGRLPVRWLSDTEELAQAYGEILSVKVAVVRIPIHGEALRSMKLRRFAPPIEVAYLGESRREKGFLLLPEIVDRVLAASSDIVFRIQLSPNITGGEEGVAEATSRLRKQAGARVVLVERAQATAELHEILARSHILLLPYQPLAYRLRSSGLLLQGLAAGARIVAPADPSWLTHCLSRNAAPDQSFTYEASAAGFAEGILAAAQAVRSRPPVKPAETIEEALSQPWVE